MQEKKLYVVSICKNGSSNIMSNPFTSVKHRKFRVFRAFELLVLHDLLHGARTQTWWRPATLGQIPKFREKKALKYRLKYFVHVSSSMLKYVYMFLGFHAYGIFWKFSKIVNQIERWWHNVEPTFKKYSKHQAWLLSRLKAGHKALPQDSNVDTIESMGFHLHWTHFPPLSRGIFGEALVLKFIVVYSLKYLVFGHVFVRCWKASLFILASFCCFVTLARPSHEIAFSLCFLSSKEAALWGWTVNRTTTSHPTVGWFYANSPSSKKQNLSESNSSNCSPPKADETTTRPVATAAVRSSSWPVPSSVAQPKSESLAQVMTF